MISFQRGMSPNEAYLTRLLNGHAFNDFLRLPKSSLSVMSYAHTRCYKANELLTCQLMHNFASLPTVPMKHTLIDEHRADDQSEQYLNIRPLSAY